MQRFASLLLMLLCIKKMLNREQKAKVCDATEA